MKIKIYDSREECLVAGAWAFMRYALNHENPVIGVCTGTTTEPIHRIVAEMYKKNPFDASGLHTFNADEYCSPKDAGVVCSMAAPDGRRSVGPSFHGRRPLPSSQSAGRGLGCRV